MARNPVTAVRPVDPASAIRPVDSGSTYFRHLDLWRITSELHAAERRAKELATSREASSKPNHFHVFVVRPSLSTK